MAAKKKTKKKAAKAASKKASRAQTAPRKASPRKASQRKGATRKKAASGVKTPTNDRVDEIQRVIGVMVEAGAVEVEMEEPDGGRLRIRLKEDPPVSVMPYAAAAAPVQAAPAMGGTVADMGGDAAAAIDDGRRQVFKSPMVGTFYRAPSPEAEVYVQVGDRIQIDSTLCILEAMKVMNEIKAEMEGTVVEILAQNGEAVEFGQPLFVIEAA